MQLWFGIWAAWGRLGAGFSWVCSRFGLAGAAFGAASHGRAPSFWVWEVRYLIFTLFPLQVGRDKKTTSGCPFTKLKSSFAARWTSGSTQSRSQSDWPTAWSRRPERSERTKWVNEVGQQLFKILRIWKRRKQHNNGKFPIFLDYDDGRTRRGDSQNFGIARDIMRISQKRQNGRQGKTASQWAFNRNCTGKTAHLPFTMYHSYDHTYCVTMFTKNTSRGDSQNTYIKGKHTGTALGRQHKGETRQDCPDSRPPRVA